MAKEQQVMTAARAIIKVKGKAIGYMKTLRTTETINRGSVIGLGRLNKRELPAMSIQCTWNCDFYFIDLKRTGIPGLDNRGVNSVEEYQDTLMLAEVPVDIYVYKKDVQSISGSLVTETKETDIAVIRNVYLNSTSWDISEGQLSARNQSGEYTDPVILPI
jgi:hypothetical protein